RREEMALSVIAGRLSQVQAARLFGVSAKIVARWVERFKAHGRAGMTDPVVAARVVALGRQRWTGQHIALEVGVSPATVSRVLRSAGLSR
ncbi:helix-turn-helix domain-containing protein, partial [Escherichia coli]|nr:helix-turn-helix domain-containing protein [Escherichia coli]